MTEVGEVGAEVRLLKEVVLQHAIKRRMRRSRLSQLSFERAVNEKKLRETFDVGPARQAALYEVLVEGAVFGIVMKLPGSVTELQHHRDIFLLCDHVISSMENSLDSSGNCC